MSASILTRQRRCQPIEGVITVQEINVMTTISPLAALAFAASGAAAPAPEAAASAAKTKKLPGHNHGAEKNN